eukprot:15479222-Alexandrium_andersonii.AAC.1
MSQPQGPTSSHVSRTSRKSPKTRLHRSTKLCMVAWLGRRGLRSAGGNTCGASATPCWARHGKSARPVAPTVAYAASPCHHI